MKKLSNHGNSTRFKSTTRQRQTQTLNAYSRNKGHTTSVAGPNGQAPPYLNVYHNPILKEKISQKGPRPKREKLENIVGMLPEIKPKSNSFYKERDNSQTISDMEDQHLQSVIREN